MHSVVAAGCNYFKLTDNKIALVYIITSLVIVMLMISKVEYKV